MSWEKVRNIYVDVRSVGATAKLLFGTTSQALGQTVEFIQGDLFKLRIHFRLPDENAGTSVVQTLPAGSVLVVAAKPASMLALPIVLFYADGFAQVGTGDDICYEADLNLNTTELASALLAAESAAIAVDIEVQNTGNTNRISYRFEATVLHQAYAGESTPTPGTPPYPAPGSLLTKASGTQAITSGADDVTITGLALAFIPAQVIVSVRKPAGGVNLFATIRDASISADGFIADLSADAPATGYKLDYLCIEEA
jgi:hypothetical protein